MGISMREAERRLDANLFLDEYPRLETGGPLNLYILQQMFGQAETAGWKKYNHGVHWGHQ